MRWITCLIRLNTPPRAKTVVAIEPRLHKGIPTTSHHYRQPLRILMLSLRKITHMVAGISIEKRLEMCTEGVAPSWSPRRSECSRSGKRTSHRIYRLLKQYVCPSTDVGSCTPSSRFTREHPHVFSHGFLKSRITGENLKFSAQGEQAQEAS